MNDEKSEENSESNSPEALDSDYEYLLTTERTINRDERSDAIRTLSEGLSNQIRNMLFLTVTYPDHLIQSGDLPEDLVKSMERIREGGSRISGILNQLDCVIHPNELETEPVNLNDVVGSMSMRSRYRKLVSDVDVSYMLDKSVPNISGVSPGLEEAVYNLVENAHSGVKKGERITISTEKVKLYNQLDRFESIPEGDYVKLSVSDTGAKIPKEDLERIFEPYFNKKRIPEIGDPGLGMAQAYRMVKDCGGYLNLSSNDKGTEISLYFPVESAKTQSVESKSSESKSPSETILVVDDDDILREVTALTVERMGYNAVALPSGEAAVNYLSSDNKADLVLLDMNMKHGIDGTETYRQILDDNPGQKAIIVSGMYRKERMDEARNLGIEYFIRKPWKKEELQTVIRDELSR